jgi:hypothetical protein
VVIPTIGKAHGALAQEALTGGRRTALTGLRQFRACYVAGPVQTALGVSLGELEDIAAYSFWSCPPF